MNQYPENEYSHTQKPSMAGKLIRAQGEHIRRVTAEEYLTDKIGSDSIECTGYIPERLRNQRG